MLKNIFADEKIRCWNKFRISHFLERNIFSLKFFLIIFYNGSNYIDASVFYVIPIYVARKLPTATTEINNTPHFIADDELLQKRHVLQVIFW